MGGDNGEAKRSEEWPRLKNDDFPGNQNWSFMDERKKWGKSIFVVTFGVSLLEFNSLTQLKYRAE